MNLARPSNGAPTSYRSRHDAQTRIRDSGGRSCAASMKSRASHRPGFVAKPVVRSRVVAASASLVVALRSRSHP